MEDNPLALKGLIVDPRAHSTLMNLAVLSSSIDNEVYS
jgi:hypothetical protein